jgi:hypothetical protein
MQNYYIKKDPNQEWEENPPQAKHQAAESLLAKYEIDIKNASSKELSRLVKNPNESITNLESARKYILSTKSLQPKMHEIEIKSKAYQGMNILTNIGNNLKEMAKTPIPAEEAAEEQRALTIRRELIKLKEIANEWEAIEKGEVDIPMALQEKGSMDLKTLIETAKKMGQKYEADGTFVGEIRLKRIKAQPDLEKHNAYLKNFIRDCDIKINDPKTDAKKKIKIQNLKTDAVLEYGGLTPGNA